MDPSERLFFDRLRDAFPGIGRLESEHLRSHGELLSHLFLGEVARHAISLFESGSDSANQELGELFGFMEREYASGAPSVRSLIALGFLENLGGPPEPYWRIRTALGPNLRKAIEEMWPAAGTP